MPVLLIGLAAIIWSGHSLVTGKGYYKGCPPGGFDRVKDPFSFWAPTIIILVLGVCMVLILFGMTSLPALRDCVDRFGRFGGGPRRREMRAD